MPKKNRNSSPITVVPFHYAVSVAVSSNIGQTNILPALFPRLLDIADGFDMYRFSKFKFRILPSLVITEMHAAGFYPGVTDNAPATFNDISENVMSCLRSWNHAIPTEWVEIPPVVLAGYVGWYKTVAGSIDAALERVGTIFVYGSSTNAVTLEFRGVCEFKGPANTGATPALRQRRMLLEEKARMLKILSLTDGDNVDSSSDPARRRLGLKATQLPEAVCRDPRQTPPNSG